MVIVANVCRSFRTDCIVFIVGVRYLTRPPYNGQIPLLSSYKYVLLHTNLFFFIQHFRIFKQP